MPLAIRGLPALAGDGVLAVIEDSGIVRGLYGGQIALSAGTRSGAGWSTVVVGPDATLYATVGAMLYVLR